MVKRPTNVNHSTSRDYERFVRQLVEQNLSGIDGLDVVNIEDNAKLTGLSGYVHQIDVAYTFRLWATDFLVIVECKQYSGSVGVDELLEFKSRIDDLRAHKGVFVTTVGFQAGAVEFAAANRIALIVARGTVFEERLYCLMETTDAERCERQLAALRSRFRLDDRQVRVQMRVACNCVSVVVGDVAVRIKLFELTSTCCT
jgi:Restriction endonuclease